MQAVDHRIQLISFTANRIVARSDRSFEAVVQSIEASSGKFDNQTFVEIVRSQQSAEQVKQAAEAMAGKSGFMIFSVLEHGKLLSLGAQRQKANQKTNQKANQKAKLYIIGNPLIARAMFQADPSMGLYVPLRLFVYESEGQTCIAYDRPSSLLGQFDHQTIQDTAQMLDDKLEAMVAAAL